MNSNKTIITIAIIFIIAIVTFMALDFFGDFNKANKNVYDYKLDNFIIVDSSLINYKEVLQIAPELEVLKAVTIDQNDNIYVSGDNSIFIYNLMKESHQRNYYRNKRLKYYR